MRMLGSIALLVFVSCAVLGCKEEEPSARKSLGGVEGQTPLKDLDDAQLDAVCGATGEKLEATFDDDDLARGACLLGAYVSGQSATSDADEAQGICESVLEGCLEAQVTPMNQCAGDVRASCTASVNDIDRCLTLAEEVYRELSDLDCEEAADRDGLDERITASATACDVYSRCFGEEPLDSGTPDASDPILDASDIDSSDPVLDASDIDDDAG